jgi:hypothetical protein
MSQRQRFLECKICGKNKQPALYSSVTNAKKWCCTQCFEEDENKAVTESYFSNKKPVKKEKPVKIMKKEERVD